MLSTDEISRYAQQIKLEKIGLAGQRRLKNARVLCIGAGGLASPLLLYLAAAGIGHLGIVDDDRIELSNLQRQILYQHAHQSHKKVERAAQQIQALNPDVQVTVYDQRLHAENAKEIIAQYDIVADCTDNFTTRYLINDVCFLLGIPFVSASVEQFEGQCTLFLGKQGPCYRCLFPTSPRTPIPTCSEGGVLGVLPGILGVIQATEIMKYLLEIGQGLSGRLLLLNLLQIQFRTIEYARDPECLLCTQARTPDFLPFPQETCPMHNEISPEALHQRMAAQEPLFLLDVRTSEEHQSYNIGGVLIPLSELPARIAELDPSVPIVAYCRSGGRSLQAVAWLQAAGFSSVQSLAGGVMAVQAAQLDFDF
jgi:molybdopterin/thiamine biosynthesis adenylyltransferase/rhodanese-related sulfurtransferase